MWLTSFCEGTKSFASSTLNWAPKRLPGWLKVVSCRVLILFMTNYHSEMYQMTRRSRRIKSEIPLIPFEYFEIQSLVNGIASSDLYQKFMVWKSTEYLNIKHAEDVIISGKNNDLSIHQKELKKRYFDWLVSIESDKFRVLESIRLPTNPANDPKDYDEGSNEGGQEPQAQKMPEIYQ